MSLASPTTGAESMITTPSPRSATLVLLATLGLGACLGPDPDAQALGQPLTVPGPITLPTTVLTVNSPNDVDDGSCDAQHCSLREALNTGNAINDFPTIRQVTIKFDLPTGIRFICPVIHGCFGRPFVLPIQLTSQLPSITRAMFIDGASQPNFAGVPLVEIHVPASATGLRLLSNNGGGLGATGVRGLSITGGAIGIRIDSTGNNISGNYIGVAPDGTPRGNGNGIVLRGAGNRIGGTTPAERNVISANTAAGVAILDNGPGGASSSQNVIVGNFIGTDVSGARALGNRIGVDVIGRGFVSGVFLGPSGTLIGGAAGGARNVISGNSSTGIHIASGASGTRVGANTIGLDVTGTTEVANAGAGIELADAPGTIIGVDPDAGSASTTSGNVISGNGGDGIRVSFAGVTTTSRVGIFANVIGANTLGAAHGNGGDGIAQASTLVTAEIGRLPNTLLDPGSVPSIDVLVGSTTLGNTIANNQGNGVFTGGTCIVRGNRIFENGGLGVGGHNGPAPTSNVPRDLRLSTQSGDFRVSGHMGFQGQIDHVFAIDFYGSPACDDPSGVGEGKDYLGTLTVGSSQGLVSGDFTARMAAVASGTAITAVATDRDDHSDQLVGSTEFSACLTVP
jgi:CSLREA domain-containing protein